MIKINRSPKPHIKSAFDCLDGSNRKIIVETLKKDTNDCCSYCCEHDISASSGEIDHFLPQANFSSKRCDWNNLFWSCRNCNKTKSNQFYGIDEKKGKGKLKFEPLKFDKTDYDFRDWFDIDSFSGNIVELHKNIDEEKYQRERTTIKLFGLNKKERSNLRLQEIKAFNSNPQSISLAKYRKLTKYFFEIK